MSGRPDGGNLPLFQAVQLDFAAHIRDPENEPAPADVEPRRMQIYVDLFYNNVEGFLKNTFPVVRSMLDDERWHAMARDFLARHRCTSPYFLDIPREFLAYLQEERPRLEVVGAEDPPWLAELCHYEYMELVLDVAEEDPAGIVVDAGGDLLDGAPRVSPLARVLGYRWPVHRLSPEFRPTEPPAEPTSIVIHRGRDERVRFVELNGLSAALLLKLAVNGEAGAEALTGRAALEALALELGHASSEAVVEGGRSLLEDLRAQGIILGTLPEGPR